VLQLHSSDYRSPAQLQPGPVLVVGMGNSGAEIALDVSGSHPTTIAGTPSGELPLRHGRAAARFVLPVVRFAGLHVLTLGTPIGRRVLPKLAGRGAPLIRTKRTDLDAAGVARVGRLVDVRDGSPVTAEGDVLDVANVIWCTGYRDDLTWVDLPAFDGDGTMLQRRGVVDAVPGLYVIGREFMYAMASATLPGATRDAAHLARRMRARRAAPSTRSASTTSASTVAAEKSS
jgi:putative flavoprotein involved in K+ transport